MSNLCGCFNELYSVESRILRFVLLSKASFLYNRILLSLCRLSDENGGGEGGGGFCQCLVSQSLGFVGYH